MDPQPGEVGTPRTAPGGRYQNIDGGRGGRAGAGRERACMRSAGGRLMWGVGRKEGGEGTEVW